MNILAIILASIALIVSILSLRMAARALAATSSQGIGANALLEPSDQSGP
jgi:hypothetical protein